MNSVPRRKPVPASARPGPGRPKDPGKRSAILEAAKRLFTLDGYAGVSMDQVASEAGVSKLTVYSHFGDKDNLFIEAVRAKCAEQMPDELFVPAPRGPLRTRLGDIARAFFALITSDEALAMHRMMLAPGGDERVRRMFWEAGPKRVQAAFAEFLRAAADRGELDVPDIERAASQFFCLLKGELHMRMLCDLAPLPTPGQVEEHLRATVELFLRAHAPATKPRRPARRR